MTKNAKKRLDEASLIVTVPLASGTSQSSPTDSANRAGSGHGGSGETPDVRGPPGLRTSNAPEDETDLMLGSVFVFLPAARVLPQRTSRNMNTISTVPGIRVRAENPNHHLWNNHGTWFLHYTVHPTPFTKERIRRSLGTKDIAVARERRDAFFAHLASEAGKVAANSLRKAVAA
jgi:hypothetical protein